jgi:hypothetical protein
MRPLARAALTVIAVALCATNSVVARTHHFRTAKNTAPAAAKRANIPPEKNRDPADVALDRRIKGICRGC